MLHVKIVKAEHNARKHIVGSHGAVSGLIAKLPYGAAVAVCQQDRPLRSKGFRLVVLFFLMHDSENFLSFG